MSPSDSHGDGHADGAGRDDEHGASQLEGVEISGTSIEKLYNSYADTYEIGIEETRLRTFQRDIFKQFPHHGFTLDLGCGTGSVGMLIRESPLNYPAVDNSADPAKSSHHQPKVYVHGVDISTNMLKAPWCVRYYDSIEHGFIQDVLVDPNPAWMQHAGVDQWVAIGLGTHIPVVDHITCFGALHFLNPTEFGAVLDRMFTMARRSVMFDVDDLSPTYIDYALQKHGEGFRDYNHVAAYRDFGTPVGWAKVVEEETVIYHWLNMGVDVKGILVRFERVN